MKILLLEDDPDISFIYKRQLEKANHPTDTFRTGKDALQALATNRYDMTLIDMMLPDTNGLEVVKQMKQNNLLDSMTVIFLTNLGQESIMQEGKKLGVDGYLIKSSMTPGQLIEYITRIHDNKHNPPPQGQE